MKRRVVLFAAPLIAILTACNSASHDADIKALRDAETQWNQQYVFKDADKIMAHYADDAVLMAPREHPPAKER